MNRKEISQLIGIDPSELCRMLNRKKYKRVVSWQQAYKLHNQFGKTVEFWKHATSSQIKKYLRIK
jgi:plasmid maintenance system antidote protein VapI